MSLKVFEFEPISSEQIRDYAEASGDWNKIHLDEEFAKAAGLPGIIAHGMLSMGLASRALSEWGISLETIQNFDCKFKEKVALGDRLKALLLSIDSTDTQTTYEIRMENQDGIEILTGSINLTRKNIP